jgi:hypothetical protein
VSSGESFIKHGAYLPVRIGDTGPVYRFLLDTGAELSGICTVVALERRLPVVDTVVLAGAAHAGRTKCFAATIRVAEGEARDTVLLDMPGLLPGVDGVLGRDAMRWLAFSWSLERGFAAITTD